MRKQFDWSTFHIQFCSSLQDLCKLLYTCLYAFYNICNHMLDSRIHYQIYTLFMWVAGSSLIQYSTHTLHTSNNQSNVKTTILFLQCRNLKPTLVSLMFNWSPFWEEDDWQYLSSSLLARACSSICLSPSTSSFQLAAGVVRSHAQRTSSLHRVGPCDCRYCVSIFIRTFLGTRK